VDTVEQLVVTENSIGQGLGGAAFKGTLFQFLNLPHATPSNALLGSDGRQLDAPLPFAVALSRSRRQSVSRLCGAAVVVVVQTTEVGNCDDRTVRRCRDGSGHWRIFVERQMRPRLQVVLDVGKQNAAQSARTSDYQRSIGSVIAWM
jgi:hypothetical protein